MLTTISLICNLIYFIFRYNKHSYEIKYDPTKHIETTERGLVVVSVNEPDGGRYDCHLGGSLLCSYSITVDAHRYDINNNNNNNNKIQCAISY